MNQINFPNTQAEKELIISSMKKELDKDPNPLMNLGTYSTPTMESEVEGLIKRVINKNLIDSTAYKAVDKYKKELISMVADLLNCKKYVGEVTSGSSEAVFISLLAHKFNWIKKNGEPKGRLNFVCGDNVHSCFDKFSKFFDVDIRKVPVTQKFEVNTALMGDYIDNNTFCLIGVIGTSETGAVDDIEEINRIASEHNIPVHVDGASGAFTLPFTNPEFNFDFKLNNVKSINISGHKFGMTFPGTGMVLIKKDSFPQGMESSIAYLSSGSLSHMNLLCTQNPAFMIGWYYNIRRLGHEGYSEIMIGLQKKANNLRLELRKMGLKVVNDSMLPVILFTSDKYNLDEMSRALNEKGWIQSPYIVTGTDTKGIRIVIKVGITDEMLNNFLIDLDGIMNAEKISQIKIVDLKDGSRDK